MQYISSSEANSRSLTQLVTLYRTCRFV